MQINLILSIRKNNSSPTAYFGIIEIFMLTLRLLQNTSFEEIDRSKAFLENTLSVV
jgi:hypothetical protein